MCDDRPVNIQKVSTVAETGPRGNMFVPVPFDPDRVWTAKARHHVRGTINGLSFRAVLEDHDGRWGFVLGPSALGGFRFPSGDKVVLVIEPEGPQRDDLDEDVAAALDANPEAGAFFDSLAQFYRKAYLRWIDGTKRRPDVRVERIDELIRLLKTGHKERPK
ncbi:hypothetical protein Rhe02_15300 [Rhizocola hellebori]|uniref:DUF1905 domain-containing protein n=1 Tax=Rhizocola hellebori TaxID=1392758 RepID=A0A8J3VF02_9ACTN|nr:hypothetical protein Rhe02_15300 [Rhizocola hellebori]